MRHVDAPRLGRADRAAGRRLAAALRRAAAGAAVLIAAAAGPAACLAQQAEPAPAERLVLDLDAAVARGLEHAFGLAIARHGLATTQSSLVQARNAFDFKVTTRFQDQRDFRRNALIVTGTPPVSFVRDVFDDVQVATLAVDKAAPWGGDFQVRTDVSRTRLRFADIEPLHEASVSLSYRQPLWGGRGRRYATADLTSATVDYADATRSLAETEMRFVVDVTRSFYAVIRSARFVEINRAAAERAEENARTFRLRLEEGLVTPIDVSRADGESKARENAVITAVEEHRAAEDDLLFLLGLRLDADVELNASEHFERVAVALDAAIGEALAHRVDLANQRDAVDLAALSADVARSNSRPRLDLTVSAGFRTVPGEEPEKLFDLADNDEWKSGVDLSYTFRDRSTKEALVRALIVADIARIRLAELERNVVREVRDAVRNVESLERQVELQDDNRKLTAESYRLARLQLEEDLIRTTDLLQIQDELVLAETAYTNALYDHEVARVNLDLVLGRYRTADRLGRSPFLRAEPAPPSAVELGVAAGAGSAAAPGERVR